MEQHIKESITDDIVRQAGDFYGVSLEDISYHGGFENFIYVFEKDSKEYILRLVHNDHNIYEHVLAEIEFVDYLALHNACVSMVIKSKFNNIVEKIPIDDTHYFSVSVFVRGLGGWIREETKNPLFWEKFGEQVGLLHKLTKTYKPIHKRLHWQDNTLYQIASKVLEDDAIIYDVLKTLKSKIVNLPKHLDNYGLIHTDLHFGNMVIDSSGALTFFDFDDAVYKHFISDIAIVIFYQFFDRDIPLKEKSEQTVWILNNFLRGYQKQNTLPKEEWMHLNTFIILREITLYTAIKAGGPEVFNSEWGSRYIKTYRDQIIHGEPYIDLDYVLEHLEK